MLILGRHRAVPAHDQTEAAMALVGVDGYSEHDGEVVLRMDVAAASYSGREGGDVHVEVVARGGRSLGEGVVPGAPIQNGPWQD